VAATSNRNYVRTVLARQRDSQSRRTDSAIAGKLA